jgi:hypothetical protein
MYLQPMLYQSNKKSQIISKRNMNTVFAFAVKVREFDYIFAEIPGLGLPMLVLHASSSLDPSNWYVDSLQAYCC